MRAELNLNELLINNFGPSI